MLYRFQFWPQKESHCEETVDEAGESPLERSCHSQSVPDSFYCNQQCHCWKIQIKCHRLFKELNGLVKVKLLPKVWSYDILSEFFQFSCQGESHHALKNVDPETDEEKYPDFVGIIIV